MRCCVCCNTRESRTIAEIFKSIFLGRGSRTTFSMSDDMIDAATAVAWWRRVGDKKIARWLDYCRDDTSPPLLPTLSS